MCVNMCVRVCVHRHTYTYTYALLPRKKKVFDYEQMKPVLPFQSYIQQPEKWGLQREKKKKKEEEKEKEKQNDRKSLKPVDKNILCWETVKLN